MDIVRRVSMASSSRAVDVEFALQRAKRKISSLQQQLSHRETSSESPEDTSLPTWTSRELRDSLVDMYSVNPGVNVELRQRLPSSARQQHNSSIQQHSNPDRSGTRLDHTEQPPPTPLSHRRSVSPVSPFFRRRSVSPLSSRPSGEMEVDLSPSRGPSPWTESCGDNHEGSRASRGPGSPSLRRPTVTADNSFLQDVSVGRPQSLDQDKNFWFLLKELDVLREHNKKLQDQLVQKEKELQRRDVEEELREELREEAQSWERPAVVLEELLVAQKDRDQALMSRLLLANEERDEAVLRARRLQQAAEMEDLKLEDTDMEVDQLLQCVCDADSVQEVQQFGSVLVQRLRLTRQRRDDITAQEMKTVLKERDGCMSRCKRLEKDLIQERDQRTTKEELLRLQRERDGALDDRRRLEVELQALRANHSSQDLLTPSCSLPGDGVYSMTLLEASPHQIPPLAEQLQEAPPLQFPPLMVQLQQLSKEKQSVEAELQRCQEAEREASERVRRLERLVEVLRKKVGTGSLRAVI